MTKNYFESKILDAESLAANFNSDPIDCVKCDNYAINISTASVTDNTGIFYVDHRIYKDANNYSDWAELTLSSTPQLANADDVLLLNLNQIPKGQIRLRFVAAGGTPDGTCDVWVSGKEV